MSKKPPKKSDLDKQWMSPRSNKSIAINPEYHLIVTEGTKTEPKYFNEVAELINRKYRGRIVIKIEGEGKSTLALLEAAKSYASQRIVNPYKHVWLIYDKDDFPPESFNKTETECNRISNSRTIFHALWSNQCIELWFLLHFIYFDSDIIRDEYYDKLSEHIQKIDGSKYEKNRDDIYTILKPYQGTAIRNAKKLICTYYENTTPSKMSPATKVFEIFEKLQPYLK